MPTVKELTVNGGKRAVQADAERTLLSVLRDDLDLTGCKYGCGEGRCGACTVLIDGTPTRSCNTKIGDIVDKPIRTVEDLGKDGKLNPLQQAFLEAGAFQCGYCTCGMLMSATGLLARTPEPSREEIIRFMSVNICRCGVYGRIVSAIEMAAKAMKEANRE
jgi:aerobic-type carbon monoxide dehydrogenase small subunit (CoxS/CutS family)